MKQKKCMAAIAILTILSVVADDRLHAVID
jgi:hypothetical protein